MPGYQNKSYSSDDDAFEAAELEAHLYSQIYHDSQHSEGDQQMSSVILYQSDHCLNSQSVSEDDTKLTIGTLKTVQKRQSKDQETVLRFKAKKSRMKCVKASTPKLRLTTSLPLEGDSYDEQAFESESESENSFLFDDNDSSAEDQLGKYSVSGPITKDGSENKRCKTKPFVANLTSSNESEYSDDDVQIISVTSGAEKRACNAEVITLDDSDASFDDEIKIPVKTITARSSKMNIDNGIAPNERNESRFEKPSKHYIAAKHSSSSGSDFSSSFSDSEDESLSRGQSMSLNLSGGRFGMNSREISTRSFLQITGIKPENHVVSSSRFKSWTPEMKKFYDSVDPSMTDITLEEIVSGLPFTASKATTLRSSMINRGRYFNSPKFQPCPNCRSRDHQSRDCNKKSAKCIMCGKSGHFKSKCPGRLCLKCGELGMPFTSSCSACPNKLKKVCFLCGAKGHHQSKCPDQWRRYHATTNTGPIVATEVTPVEYAKMWCPNCGRKGHLVHQCRAYSFGSCPRNVLTVLSYDETDQGSDTLMTGSARRKKMLEIKEKRRAFKTFPHSLKAIPDNETSKRLVPLSQEKKSSKQDKSLISEEQKFSNNSKSRNGGIKLRVMAKSRFFDKSFPRHRQPSPKEDLSEESGLGLFSRLGRKQMPDFIRMPSANGAFGPKKSKSPKKNHVHESDGPHTYRPKRLKKRTMRRGEALEY